MLPTTCYLLLTSYLQILGSFVFLNLVVAVILENFSSLGNLNPDLVSAADIEIFKEVQGDIGRYVEMRGDTGRYREIFKEARR